MLLRLHFFAVEDLSTTVEIKFWSLIKKQESWSVITIKEDSYLSFDVDYKETVSDDFNYLDEHTIIPDPRIFIKSTAKIKVVAQLADKETGRGDVYLVPQVNKIATTFLINLPKAAEKYYQIIHLLPSSNYTANVHINHLIEGKKTIAYNLTLDHKIGSPQNIIVVPSDVHSHSISILSNVDVYITAAVICIDLASTNNFDTKHTITYCDYSAMMVHPTSYFYCKTALNAPGDSRMITSKYTKAISVSPPAIPSCTTSLPLIIYDTTHIVSPAHVDLSPYSALPFQMLPKDYQMGIVSIYDFTPWIRFGGFRDIKNSGRFVNSFIHYVPETSQFITGVIQFITFSPNDNIEVYIRSNDNPADFLLDGRAAMKSLITNTTMPFFRYTWYNFRIEQPGLHTFNSSGRYSIYVIGKNIANQTGAYGYIAGYNKNSLGKHSSTGFSIFLNKQSEVVRLIIHCILVLFSVQLMIINVISKTFDAASICGSGLIGTVGFVIMPLFMSVATVLLTPEYRVCEKSKINKLITVPGTSSLAESSRGARLDRPTNDLSKPRNIQVPKIVQSHNPRRGFYCDETIDWVRFLQLKLCCTVKSV
uniref:IgGFc_binding domain-containing protein n=1 Tax=Rhabditophanes sp. KR3021 TaxID=114890 RepID=A0AC35TLR3_9BILA